MASVTSWLQSGTCIGTPPQVMCGLGGIHFGLRQLCLESCGVSYRLQFSHSPTKQLRFRPRLCKNLQLDFIRCPTWPSAFVLTGFSYRKRIDICSGDEDGCMKVRTHETWIRIIALKMSRTEQRTYRFENTFSLFFHSWLVPKISAMSTGRLYNLC